MKLLFLTQVLDEDDAILGFVPRWVSGLAQHCERVRVVALAVGRTASLPGNVDWREVGRRGRLVRYLRYRRILEEALGADGFDTVLAHMVPRYALVAAGPARRHGARLFLWYTTAGVDARLRRSLRVVEKVFTASPESLRVETDRAVVTGHGIDLAHFDARKRDPAAPRRIVSVGRLTRAKDPLTVLAALSILISRGYDLHLDLVGGTMTSADEGYARSVAEQIEYGGLEGRVHLSGAVPYPEVPGYFHRATVLVNASLTGSLDKVVLEGMAAGLPFVSCSDAAPGLVAELGRDARRFLFTAGSADELAERIEGWLAAKEAERRAFGDRLRAIVARDHDVDALMARLVSEMGGDAGGDVRASRPVSSSR